MLYRSTNGKAPKVGFLDTLMRGIAPDGGLYMPDGFPIGLEIDGGSFPDRAGQLLWNFVPRNGLNRICCEAFNFPVPLVQLSENLFVLELFHGPTLSFKDFGARFMAQAITGWGCIAEGDKLNIVVATSGDTGSAVANAFHQVPGVNVFVLYPKGRITELQEKQMATLGGNVFALKVDGDFDDCHRVAKEVLNEGITKGRKKLKLSSANSINPGRLLPQMSYYLEAKHQLRWKYGRDEDSVFVVPSGNFGNLTAGLFAGKMGVKAKKMVAAVNLNSRVPEYLEIGRLPEAGTIPTVSNSMDVGRPSNWARVIDFFHCCLPDMNDAITAMMVNGHDTLMAITNTHKKFKYIIDPHTAVGMRAAEEIMTKGFDKDPIIVLSTAHPAKFRESVEPAIGEKVELPERLAAVLEKKNLSIEIEPDKKVLTKIIKAAQ